MEGVGLPEAVQSRGWERVGSRIEGMDLGVCIGQRHSTRPKNRKWLLNFKCCTALEITKLLTCHRFCGVRGLPIGSCGYRCNAGQDTLGTLLPSPDDCVKPMRTSTNG